MSETISLKLLGSYLVQELEKLRTLSFDDPEAGVVKLRQVELSIPFATPPGIPALPVIIGVEDSLMSLEVLKQLEEIGVQAFVESHRFAQFPNESVAEMALRIKF
jgi:hypothetical protein